MEDEPDEFADVVHHRLTAGDQGTDVPHDRGDHVATRNPPGDAFAGREGRGEQGQDEGPREAGVREVEDVVVDELARFLDEPPDAGETLAIRDRVAMMPTSSLPPRAPMSTGKPDGSRGGHRPRGYSLKPGNGCDAHARAEPDSYQTGPVYFSPGPWPGSSGAALDSRNANCSVFSPSRTGPACGPRSRRTP